MLPVRAVARTPSQSTALHQLGFDNALHAGQYASVTATWERPVAGAPGSPTAGAGDRAQTALECRTCGARLSFEAGQLTTTCVYCGSPAVIQLPPDPSRPVPLFAIGFAVSQDAALELARKWQRRLGLFRHPGVKRARLEAIHAVYLPAYLYGAIANARYHAEIGEDYHEGTGKNRRRRTEYMSLSGAHASYVRDVVVTASRAIDNRELARVEPFDLTTLQRFSPALVSGWPAETPSHTPDECLALARGEALSQITAALTQFMPGDRHRNLSHETQLDAERLELCLLPLWVLPVHPGPGQPLVRLLINGQSGKAFAHVPLSALRIAICVGALVLLGGVFVYWFGVAIGVFEGIGW
jgi:hypothetical protein